MASEESFTSIEFESQPLLITEKNDYKESVSSQSSLFDLSQKSNPMTAIKKHLLDSNTSLPDKMEIQEESSYTSSTAQNASSKRHRKNE